ncbi:hypothetical protein LEP1GSC166_3304 [Leptospira kirschneri]|uniref:Uncharacterized protein n=1 Tax=Leptospira kirschneri serovar Bulgarica str. Nikolaevo TaxID=1240687 RepID=M6F894_9LEPT|nr:hypothetical protein LEP1GSC198_2385 [Leptospira kirschneri str. JB]EMK04147.1 hypothetical protein LEP1GSC166_3304 [Leptospira kirschneri]EMK24968.1 hypothetical protein LEP1GSC008_3073 [Leptospira kirschneri serovar Bulgarica str. Nikolaevo]
MFCDKGLLFGHMKIVSENEWTILERFRNSQKLCLIRNCWFFV